MQSIMKTLYEVIMVLLVMLTIMTIWTEEAYNQTINFIVWIVFVVDYFFRLHKANEKWYFVKQNPFLLIAIIPLDQFFQIARIVRIIYLFRIKTITKYYISPYIEKLSFQSMTLLLTILFGLLFAEAAVIYKLESSIQTYLNAVYIIFGHLFTFGNQIHLAENVMVMWLLISTSIIGILVQGLALQWGFAKIEKFLPKFKKSE